MIEGQLLQKAAKSVHPLIDSKELQDQWRSPIDIFSSLVTLAL